MNESTPLIINVVAHAGIRHRPYTGWRTVHQSNKIIMLNISHRVAYHDKALSDSMYLVVETGNSGQTYFSFKCFMCRSCSK